MAAARLQVGPAVTRFTTAVGECILTERAASGLSAIQLQVLRLASSGETVAALTRILGCPKSTMTSVLDQLEALGLVARTSDPDDRRRQVVRSTAAGSARLDEFDAAIERHVDGMLTGLSIARRRRLEQLMAKLPSARVPMPLSGPG